jgi:hypothetical protein
MKSFVRSFDLEQQILAKLNVTESELIEKWKVSVRQ